VHNVEKMEVHNVCEHIYGSRLHRRVSAWPREMHARVSVRGMRASAVSSSACLNPVRGGCAGIVNCRVLQQAVNSPTGVFL
jgi:hypothetical protein